MITELMTSHLFTPERLFGEVATSGLSRHAVFLERAKAEAARNETAVRFALGAYLVVRLIDTYFLVGHDDYSGEREGFLWQHSAVKRHMDELPGDLAETSHLHGIVDAVPLDGGACSTLRISLTAYAYFLEHEERLQEALEILTLAARAHGTSMPAGDFAACALFAGRLNRRLAKWDAAIGNYEACDEAARLIDDHVTAFRSRIGCTAVYRVRGNLPMARALIDRVVKDAGAMELLDVQADAYAELGAVYTAQGNQLEALEAGYKAFLLTSDPVRRMRNLGDLGIDLVQVGAYSAARLAFEIVINSKANFRLCTNALLELMELESLVGNRVAFERYRTTAEASRDRMMSDMATDFLYKMGLGFARFGKMNRAGDALRAALNVAETHRLNTWYFKVEQALQELETSHKHEQLKEFTGSPVVQEMEAGLREYVALQPA